MKVMKVFGAMFTALFFFVSCGTYHTEGKRPHLIPEKESKVLHQDDIRIIVYPIVKEGEIKRYFDDNLLKDYGIIPIYINIDNFSRNEIFLKSVKLKVSDGIIEPVSPDDVYKMVKVGPAGYVGRAYFWGSFSYGIGSIIVSRNIYKNNEIRERDIKDKNLDPQEIKSLGTIKNFVYFQAADKEKPPLPASLIVQIKKDNGIIEYEIPLS